MSFHSNNKWQLHFRLELLYRLHLYSHCLAILITMAARVHQFLLLQLWKVVQLRSIRSPISSSNELLWIEWVLLQGLAPLVWIRLV
jgi:hypothetical protein